MKTVVYWGTQWRRDQKEPALREAVAYRGIQNFFAQTDCLSVAGMNRIPLGETQPSDQDLLRLSSRSAVNPERVVLIVVHELGPRLSIGLPFLVEGGTEVLIDVQVLAPRHSDSLARTRVHWRNGGPFVIKGVESLDRDMTAALTASFRPGDVEKCPGSVSDFTRIK